jgi:hypothetical protein
LNNLELRREENTIFVLECRKREKSGENCRNKKEVQK